MVLALKVLSQWREKVYTWGQYCVRCWKGEAESVLRELRRERWFCSWKGERRATESPQRMWLLASRKWALWTTLSFPKPPPWVMSQGKEIYWSRGWLEDSRWKGESLWLPAGPVRTRGQPVWGGAPQPSSSRAAHVLYVFFQTFSVHRTHMHTLPFYMWDYIIHLGLPHSFWRLHYIPLFLYIII